MTPNPDERSPLLRQSSQSSGHDDVEVQQDGNGKRRISFKEDDPSYPRNWPYRRKIYNVLVIASMAIMSPLASAAFTPAISVISEDLGASKTEVIAATTGFVIMLGVGPLVLAPLSETFGRRAIYNVCFTVFTLLQIPTALAPNTQIFLLARTVTGFFGSVGIANGGGTISDMFIPSERAGVFGIYLLGPILGPALGPLMGGLINQFLSWRWIFWVTGIISAVINISGLLFLRETYPPAILSMRKKELAKEDPSSKGMYTYEGEDPRPLWRKILNNLWRPIKILVTQPIVLTMASYQAVLWACNYSLYTQFETIWGKEYGFEDYQIGLMYLPMGAGLLMAALFVVPKIDTVYNWLSKRHGGTSQPEFRLPLANIGSVTTPVCLFAFAWLVEFRAHWALIFVLVPFGLGQVSIFNCTQNFYIDAFEKYAASAIAAGSLFRSLIGGIVPLFMPALIEREGYGWGISVFGFVSLLLAPAPILFYYCGPALRKRFKISL